MANEKKRAVKRSNTSLKDLSKVLEDHGRHSMLPFLSSLPISVLRILDTEANIFYDRNHQLYDAALLIIPPGFNCWFSFAPVFQWCCSTPKGSPGVGRNTFLSSPHLCSIIVFICDLFVSRNDPLMS